MLDKSLFSKVDQIGVVVRDMDKAIERYQSLGIGPFEPLKPGSPIIEKRIMGKPVPLDSFNLTIRVAYIGTVQLELIEPGQKESLWRQHLDTKGEGINHLGFLVDDIDEAIANMEKRGYKTIYSSKEANGNGSAYFDTAGVGGILIELRKV
jgi:catechol 2,3-dioxygenase-like lactoylglutathione lyase family enzyme